MSMRMCPEVPPARILEQFGTKIGGNIHTYIYIYIYGICNVCPVRVMVSQTTPYHCPLHWLVHATTRGTN
ncbi:hypothetical protein Naga_101989g2 [Nannochloropsis gaditana]|uniref:Uncharacterized protein n=1 Tax=Nannochloropsis gaditana TaxID=72520 RepID=W7TJR6_9STRA|nr:hypothetical protein Naga_101989g2 [Nannochloropsis gaditana]